MSEAHTHQPSEQGDQRRGEQFGIDSETDEIVTDVVEAVAAYRGTDPLSIEPRLGDVIDADALGRILETGNGSVEVEFEFASCRILVTDGGEIFVREARTAATREA